jgi:branched-chain amino acid aminotransferase
MTQLTNSRLAWFNVKFMPENQVLIPFRDRSWGYGDGAFDMTRTFNGRAFRLKEHIDRFYCSLRYLRLDPEFSPYHRAVLEFIGLRDRYMPVP